MKARVEAGPDPNALGDAAQALVDEGQEALGGVDAATPQPGVQAEPGLGDEAKEWMQGVALQVRAVGTLAP